MQKTEVRFKNLSIKNEGHPADDGIELRKGNLFLKHSLSNELIKNNRMKLRGDGLCEFIEQEADGVTLPVLSDPISGKKLGDILIYVKGVEDYKSFKDLNGNVSALEITGPNYNCDNQEDFNIYMTATQSSKGWHNMGKGPWGENGWINAPSFKLFGHKFERKMTYEGRMYLEFRKSYLEKFKSYHLKCKSHDLI